MKIPAIKKLVESFDIHSLVAAEEAILEEQQSAIEIEGEDEGEQLTHVMAAIWIKTKWKNRGCFPSGIKSLYFASAYFN